MLKCCKMFRNLFGSKCIVPTSIRSLNIASSLNRESNSFDLILFNSFTQKSEPVVISGHKVRVNDSSTRHSGSAYICGPTVYDDSHLGHAITYIRFDLFRRVLANYCSTDLVTVMNVTDVDDKIIRRSIDRQCSSSQIADTYLDSFIEDLRSLNIQMPDALIRVTDKIDSIVRFIQQIERNANAYVNPSTGDVCIKSSELNENKKSSHSNFISPGLADGKQSPEDFVLWKAAKPNEPYWIYSSVTTGQDIRGRPGWHVECSTIANEALGPHVDFHFGGQDLMFPHHFNESACCAAWNRSHDSQSSHEWVSHWIHFGKLIVKNEKMSKSLGNGISVKQHLVTHAPQLLRIACLLNPYKRDIYYDDDSPKKWQQIHSKLSQFKSIIHHEIYQKCTLSSAHTLASTEQSINLLIDDFRRSNLTGIANNMNLSIGFNSFLDLIDEIQLHLNKFQLCDLIKLQNTMLNYFNSIGLNDNKSNDFDSAKQALHKLIDFRSKIRTIALGNIKSPDKDRDFAKQMLSYCDDIREQLKREQIFLVDKKV